MTIDVLSNWCFVFPVNFRFLLHFFNHTLYLYTFTKLVCERMAAETIMADEELPSTLTPREDISQESSSGSTVIVPWGRLIACKTFVKNVDLVESFSFGRGEQCSITVTKRSCPSETLHNISKLHFQIDKCHVDNLVYITDLSKNGTFINVEKIGTGNRKILKDNDQIAISMSANPVYVFMSHGTEGVSEFLPEQLMARFANVRQLGRGSCGEVRLVRDRNTLKSYAIKKIILSESNSSQVHKINHPNKIQNEISILKHLSHPCIIGISDIVQVKNEVYLVLDYMSGGELTNRIINRRLTEDLIKFYFLQMVLATEYLHSCGVIHRDLKPENILLLDNRDETLLKITDFGLSKISDQSDATTMCGTLRYVAPEVIDKRFRNLGEYGKEVDIWSLGVILYFMISGDFPFKGEEHSDIAQHIIKGEYDLSGNVWAGVEKNIVKNLIRKMLQRQPQSRIQISQIIYHNWIRHDHGVRHRVTKLLECEGLKNPMEELSLEPSPKKFKFSVGIEASSSDESNTR